MCKVADGFNNPGSGPDWKCTSDVPDSDICGWFGVTCSTGGSVVQILIGDTFVSGTLSSYIGQMTALTSLEISAVNLGELSRQKSRIC